MTTNFSKNLRRLCSEHFSIAQVCREINFNRQQFNRYLNGGGMPSAHNLRRISQYFGVSVDALMLDEEQFSAVLKSNRYGEVHRSRHSLDSIFVDQARHLRRYLGYYHGHFQTPTWEGGIIRTLIRLQEENGKVVSYTLERAKSQDGSVRQRTRHLGLVAFQGNRIYLIENSNSEDNFISSTIMFPEHRQKINLVQGLTMGVATKPRVMPYATPIVWKRITDEKSARWSIEQTGIFSTSSTAIDPVIRKLLTGVRP
ncbi:Helix-turn-helix domain protein [Pseudovibrio sp. Ad13]|uniref:helix-turn-helix transcriptional regulator n=1 Tax=unclassified Pseudovibrio TaxID=2627060 RepID=UPI0007B20C44|nr:MULTISPECIES: helix-turn-helix transcriptional regulator [unclassified Pseudovibrio]KZK83433.1 Helix-turn-helix domain protein [Pseudovibrio sp. Ad13]